MPRPGRVSAAVHDVETATARSSGGHSRGVEEASGAEPVMELVGWNAEPLLLRRLKVHVIEGCLEASGLVVGIILVNRNLYLAGLISRLLMMPLGVICLKLAWALRLAWGKHRIDNAKDFATALKRLGNVHTRSFWVFSAGFFICFSCILMMWYGILLLLMTSYEYRPEEAQSVRYVIGMALVFGLANWAFWRDFVRNCKDTPDEEEGPEALALRSLFRMYRKKAIRVLRYGEVAAESKATDGDESLPAECAICLEQFQPEDDVAKLPCGHIFHPVCAHRWIREDWRCPFRCSLQQKSLQDKATADAEASEEGTTSTHAEAAVQATVEDRVQTVREERVAASAPAATMIPAAVAGAAAAEASSDLSGL